MSVIPYTTGNFPTYRFYLTYLTITYEVFPLNFNETQLVDELEKDQVFYRRKFKGTLLFGTNDKVIDVSGVEQNRMDDFTLLWGIESLDPCARLDLTITKTVSGVVDTYWEGFFSTTDGTIDIDKCTFEVTPLADDDYADMLDKANTQWNIFAAATVVTTRGYVEFLYDETYTNNRWLARIGSNSVLEYLADSIKTGVNISSDFFTDATNYVTLNDNKLLYLTIAQKSDIKRPLSTAPATIMMMSWKELMDILWAMFQVKWNYDPDTDTINVEHISWFTPGAGIDLRTQELCVATNKYNYLKTEMPKYEKFYFMESNSLDFVGIPIFYDSNCVDSNPSTNIKETKINVTTELQYIMDDVDDATISDEGFVILCNYLDGTYFVKSGVSIIDGSVALNMDLSRESLNNCFFRHNRVLIEGYINGSLQTFWTTQKNKNQKCSAIICDTFDPSQEITTELGETYLGVKASVLSAYIHPSGLIDFDLIYGAPENINTGAIEGKAILVVQAANCMNLSATLTEVAPVGGLEILVREKIYNAADVLQCTGDWETWTIAAGSYSDSFSFADFCSSQDPGFYSVIEFDFTGCPGWSHDETLDGDCLWV